MLNKILPDMYSLENLLEQAKEIENPETLSYVVEQSKDLIDNYVNELKGIPQEINQWMDTIENITGLSINTELSDFAKKIYTENSKNGIINCLERATSGLKGILSSNTETFQDSLFMINDIPINFVFKILPKHKASSISQPIISEKIDVDRLNEDVENTNDTYDFKIALTGEDRYERYKKIIALKEKKKINKFVFNEVYEQMLITDISLEINNTNTLNLDISAEKIFVASLTTIPEAVAGYETENKSTSNVGKQGSLPITKS